MTGPDLVRRFRRRRALLRLSAGPVRRYVESATPGGSTSLAEARLLAVDLETTGLDPRRDRVLSAGFIPVDGERIVLAGAGAVLLRPDAGSGDEAADGVGQSAIIHGLTDDTLASGVPAGEFLDTVFDALTGRVLLAHFAELEVGFLSALCRRVHGVSPPISVVDTLELQRRVLTGGLGGDVSTEPTRAELRLWGARDRYGLPRYRAHDAVVDALACAELYLAQVAELGERGATSLRDLRTT